MCERETTGLYPACPHNGILGMMSLVLYLPSWEAMNVWQLLEAETLSRCTASYWN